MNRTLLVVLVGIILFPAVIVGGSAAYETHKIPSDCKGREPWLLESVNRYVAAEGAAGAVNRFDPGATTAAKQGVADAYATAEAEQKASNPPAPEEPTNELLTEYFTMMNANWTGWVSDNYVNAYYDYQVQAVFTSLQSSLKSAENHCS